jgi:hypothetical protein
LTPGETYVYTVQLLQNGVTWTDVRSGEILFRGAELSCSEIQSAHPNPFNPTTTISYSLSQPGHVSLAIYNIRGERVTQLENRQLSPGQYTHTWTASDDHGRALPSGIYFAVLKTAEQSDRLKIMLVK